LSYGYLLKLISCHVLGTAGCNAVGERGLPVGAELTLVRDRDPLAVRTTSMDVPSQMTTVEAVFRLVNRHLRLPVHVGGVVSCYSSRVISSTLLRANSFAWQRGLTKAAADMPLRTLLDVAARRAAAHRRLSAGRVGGHITGSAERGAPAGQASLLAAMTAALLILVSLALLRRALQPAGSSSSR
jgi:hypothetical protein